MNNTTLTYFDIHQPAEEQVRIVTERYNQLATKIYKYFPIDNPVPKLKLYAQDNSTGGYYNQPSHTVNINMIAHNRYHHPIEDTIIHELLHSFIKVIYKQSPTFKDTYFKNIYTATYKSSAVKHFTKILPKDYNNSGYSHEEILVRIITRHIIQDPTKGINKLRTIFFKLNLKGGHQNV